MRLLRILRELTGMAGLLMFVGSDGIKEEIWKLPVGARVAVFLLFLYFVWGAVDTLFPPKKS